jgi:hypothetical protein
MGLAKKRPIGVRHFCGVCVGFAEQLDGKWRGRVRKQPATNAFLSPKRKSNTLTSRLRFGEKTF